jgi:hypothetical protein
MADEEELVDEEGGDEENEAPAPAVRLEISSNQC